VIIGALHAKHQVRVNTLLQYRRRASLSSFSLLEILLVLALVAIVVAIAMSAYTGMAQSTAVSTGADMISDVLAEARTSAIAQNTTVEVRIYNLAPQSAATPAYDALQLHWLKADGTTPPVANALLLPAWVVIDPSATHSPLIASSPDTPTPDASDMRLNAQTCAFRYLPDGSTDLNPATNWFMTVRAASQSDPTDFPSNWACVRVDPTTGRPQIYRP
jgi:uncharacterized protein (TIGR02596 family)